MYDMYVGILESNSSKGLSITFNARDGTTKADNGQLAEKQPAQLSLSRALDAMPRGKLRFFGQITNKHGTLFLNERN